VQNFLAFSPAKVNHGMTTATGEHVDDMDMDDGSQTASLSAIT
jgi:hypothetical protein